MITVHCPKGGTPPDLQHELSSARNIKDKSNRVNTLSGLRAISKYL